jgi:cyclase
MPHAYHPRALAARPYDRGLHDLGNGAFAYLQPDGSWGWSNSGLIVDGSEALLVDTLFDLRLTREMLEAMRRADPRAADIGTLVTTHANPDHTNGNSLLPGVEIVASARAAEEMAASDPANLARMMRNARAGSDRTSRYLVEAFGAFDFEGIPPTAPTRAFSGTLSLTVGEKRVELRDFGPAHTGGDIAIHVPGDRIVFTGDLLFVGGHPLMWAGPIENWIAACDWLLALDVDLIVPGHGPITDHRGVAAVRDYLVLTRDAAVAAYATGVPAADAAVDIAAELDRSGYEDWCDRERVIANVIALYRNIEGRAEERNPGALFAAMAEFRDSNGERR